MFVLLACLLFASVHVCYFYHEGSDSESSGSESSDSGSSEHDNWCVGAYMSQHKDMFNRGDSNFEPMSYCVDSERALEYIVDKAERYYKDAVIKLMWHEDIDPFTSGLDSLERRFSNGMNEAWGQAKIFQFLLLD